MARSRTSASYGNVHEFATGLGLGRSARERALELADLKPSPTLWRRYLDRFLMAVGVALIVAGITAFFAWNWAGLAPFQKFALIQIAIVSAVLATWRLGMDSVGGRGCLFAAAFLIGVLLAVFGQIYQTGADPYGLFFGWAVLILPFALIGRQAGIWMLLLILINLGTIMYWTQVLNPPDGWWQLSQLLGPIVWLGTTITSSSLASILFVLNVLALIIWEMAGSRWAWCRGRLFPRITAFLALATVLIPTLLMIFIESADGDTDLSVISPALYLAATALGLYYYQFQRRDLLILTQCLFGVILVVMAMAIRVMFEGFESTLVLAILLLGQTAGAAWWLRGVSRRWEQTA